ncbi:hypothetical protein ACQ4PT_024030 [Festuca glaucescens]
MSKRYSDGRVCGKHTPRRRYLYLIMNDGVAGYAIRKFDLSVDSHDNTDCTVVQCPPPAIVRFESLVRRFFAAIGSKIMAMHSNYPLHVVPVYDVRTQRVTLGPWWETPFLSQPVYLAVGDKLVVLDKHSSGLLYPRSDEMDWAWMKLPNDFFMLQGITSYAVHPDGKTIVVSVETSTFSLDTESADPKWRFHGDWMLPFAGCGHFVPDLGAWVGISGDPTMLGCLCSCAVFSPDSDPCRIRQPPASKLSKKKLFCVNPAEEHIGANLVYMGARGFCLVQYFSVEDYDTDGVSSSDDTEGVSSSDDTEGVSSFDYVPELAPELAPSPYRLRLTMFSLKYDKEDLLTETPCRVICYKLPRESDIHRFNDPPAFWM